MTARRLRAEAQKLTSEQVAELTNLLLLDTVSRPDPAVEEAWGKEIERRLAQLESGKVTGIPAEEVFAHARKPIGR